jgi:hypothetical protein
MLRIVVDGEGDEEIWARHGFGCSLRMVGGES